MGTAELRIEVLSDGLRLNCGAFSPDDVRGLAVLLHGIPSTAPPDPSDEGYPGLARRFAERGFTAVWGDMRGVRGSEGDFSIEGWVRDASALVDATREIRESSRPLVLLGSSAGGAVAAEAARRGVKIDALVLLAAPAQWVSFADDAHAGVRRIIEQAGMPVSAAVRADPAAWAAEFEKVTTESSVAELDVPILIVHGTADDVVPVAHAYRIAEAAPAARLEIVEGAPHHLRRDERALALVFDWLDEVLG